MKKSLDKLYPMDTLKTMTGKELQEWRRQWGLTQEGLARLLGVIRLTVARWETGARAIPSFLPLALEALENRIKMEASHGKDQQAG
jgi:DNA-binding transcriptional regulator YiaG